MKKTIASLGLAGLLVLGGAALGASAEVGYPSAITCTVSPASVGVNTPATIRCTGFTANSTVTFTTTGGTLSSIVHAAAAGVPKTADATGAVTARFQAATAGTYTVTAAGTSGDTAVTGSVTVTVTGSALPTTGGQIPTGAIWLGIGALGLGGIAVTAAVARRRAAQQKH